jgi:small subunit ribosomal protein S10
MTDTKLSKTRIYLESFDKNLLNLTCKKIQDLFQQEKKRIVGPISFPMKKRIYCVLRSPHVDKDSREHLEIRSYKRIFDIYALKNVNLLQLDIPAGVSVSFS